MKHTKSCSSLWDLMPRPFGLWIDLYRLTTFNPFVVVCICLDQSGGSLWGGAHSGLHYLLSFIYLFYSSSASCFFCFLFLPSASSFCLLLLHLLRSRLHFFYIYIYIFFFFFLGGGGGRRDTLPFLAGEVGCLFCRIFLCVVVMLRRCVRVAVSDFLWSVTVLTKDESPHTGYISLPPVWCLLLPLA